MTIIANKKLLSLAVAAAVGGYTSVSLAQSDEPVVEEVVEVTGFRSSLIQARDLKRESLVAQDSIVAEDIADFPDLNLADSLQRISGITITREGGEGRQISLRGLGPDFTRVQVNGMEALGTSSSPIDSRGQTNRGRGFDFNIFASELFNRIDVKKSFSADQDEGGIAGTVELHTARPFDFDGFKGAIAGNLGTNTNTDSTDPRIAAMVSNTWDNFGALVSVAYSERESSEQSSNTFRWRDSGRVNIRSFTDENGVEQPRAVFGPNVSQEVQDQYANGELWLARGNRYTNWTNEQERLGITGSFQWVPSDNLTVALDILYGEFNNSRVEYHLDTAGRSSTLIPDISGQTGTINQLVVEPAATGDLEVVFLDADGVTVRTETRKDQADTTFEQYTLTAEWDISERLRMSGLIGHSESDFQMPQNDKVYFDTVGRVTTDYRPDRFYAQNTYGFDTTDPTLWNVRELDFREDYQLNEFDNLKLDFEFDLTDNSQIQFGINAKTFTNSGLTIRANDLIKDVGTPAFGPETGVAPTTVDGNLFQIYSDHPSQSWVAANVDAVQELYGVRNWNLRDPSVRAFYDSTSRPQEFDDRPQSNYSVEEETLSLYAQYLFENQIGDMTLRGSFGLRHYDTETTSSGVAANDERTPLNVTNTYDGVLPALNLALDINDNLVWRVGASENVTRPSLGSLSVSARVETDPDATRGLNVSSGNPRLDPFESTSFNTSLEYYWGDVGLLAVGFFRTDIDNFVVSDTIQLTYGELGLPLELLPPDQDANTVYDFRTVINGDDATLTGIEVSFQRDFDFLPAPFNNLGVIANATFADGEQEYDNVQDTGESQTKNFPGLSEESYNFTLYYETEKVGARVAVANRGEYITVVEAGLGDEDERGIHETTFVDFSAFYQVNDSLKFTFEAINLTDEREELYSDTSDRLFTTTEAGTTYLFGVNYQF